MIEARIYKDGEHLYTVNAEEIRSYNVIEDVTRPDRIHREHDATGDQLICLVVKGRDPARVETALQVVETILSEKGDHSWTRR